MPNAAIESRSHEIHKILTVQADFTGFSIWLEATRSERVDIDIEQIGRTCARTCAED